MSCRKYRRWHFRDPKLKNFLGVLPQVWDTIGALSFLLLQNLMLRFWVLPFYSLWNQCPSLEEETCSRWGWSGGWGCILKIVIAGAGGGGTIFICNYFGGFKFWYTTLLKTPAALWDVINDQSLTKGVTKRASWIESKTVIFRRLQNWIKGFITLQVVCKKCRCGM